MEEMVPVGTVVRIKTRNHSVIWVPQMGRWEGRLMTVEEVNPSKYALEGKDFYRMKEDVWIFGREDFDIVENGKIIEEPVTSPSDEDFLRLFGM